MIKAVIFDMDGLLINSEPIWRRVEIKVFSGLGVSINEDNVRATMGMRVDEVTSYWYERHAWATPSQDQVAQALIDGVVAGVKADGQPMPGVDHALNICSQAGLPLALASSSRYAVIDAVVDKFGIRDRFKVIRSAQDEPLGKPNPAINISTAKELGVLPENCLIFEDSIKGVIAAKAAKAYCVAVPAPEDRHQPQFSIADMVLDSLEDFTEDILNKINLV
ncbi:hexitol phosphatase HxpB [Candidatus Saccharibacteria bacterium]|nr:hexitol phosphatase HxpB [Candidatus Saccharibacteria bacterium]